MPRFERRHWWRCLAFACVIVTAVCPAANAKESSGSAKNAEEYLAKGDLKAAEIELKNAIRQSPQDPMLRVRLAQVYLQLGDPASAEFAARAAKERNAEEADYLPVLADALLRQEKFQALVDLIQAGDRAPALESQMRSALGLAALGLHDQDKAEQMLRDAIRLDPGRIRTEGCAGPASRDPRSLPAHLNRANINIAEGKFKTADEDLDPVPKALPNNFMANYLRALELAKQQQYAAADRIFDRISPARFPDSGRATTSRGR